MTERKEGFAYIRWDGKEYPVDVKHSELFKKLKVVRWDGRHGKQATITVVMIDSGIATNVFTIDYVDDNDNQHGHEVPALLYANYKDLKDGKDEVSILAVSNDLLWREKIGTAKVIFNPLKENKGQWGGKREGAGRKFNENKTKSVIVRITPAQHEKFKELGGSNWLQDRLDSLQELSGKHIVITSDYKDLSILTDKDISEMENFMGRVRWEEDGPFIFNNAREAIEQIADAFSTAIDSENIRRDVLEQLNSRLIELIKYV